MVHIYVAECYLVELFEFGVFFLLFFLLVTVTLFCVFIDFFDLWLVRVFLFVLDFGFFGFNFTFLFDMELDWVANELRVLLDNF